MIRKGGSRFFNGSFIEIAAPEQSMRRTLRKSIPFVWALLIGTLAGACVAGLALFVSHS
jgi:hypothetical protein